MLNESAAQDLHAHVGSVLEMRGYRPSQLQQVMNGTKVPPKVGAGQRPGDRDHPAAHRPDRQPRRGCRRDVHRSGRHHRDGRLLPEVRDLRRQLHGHVVPAQARRGGPAGVRGPGESGWPATTRSSSSGTTTPPRAAFAQRGTTLEALALLVFAIIVALALLVVVGQSLARQAYAAAGRLPGAAVAWRHPPAADRGRAGPGGAGRRGRDGAGGPGRLRAVGFTPIGLARRAEISPGFAFDAAAVLGGAAVLALLLAGRAALAAPRAARTGARGRRPPAPARDWRGGWPAGGCPRPRCRGSGWRSSRAAAARPSPSARRSSGWRRRSPRCWRRWCSAPACPT